MHCLTPHERAPALLCSGSDGSLSTWRVSIQYARDSNATRRLLRAASTVRELSSSSVRHCDRSSGGRVEKLDRELSSAVNDVAVSSDGDSAAVLCGGGVTVNHYGVKTLGVARDVDVVGGAGLFGGRCDCERESVLGQCCD